MPPPRPQLLHTSLQFLSGHLASSTASGLLPAMAHHSPSPSGSCCSRRRRRLSELLGEQQEPFYLDLYLLEKGCSAGFLDAAACGGGACSTCWPRARSTGGRLLRRPAARNKKAPRGSGVLRLLLSKILSGATTARAPGAATAAAKKKRPQPAAIEWRHADCEKQGAPSPSTDATVASPQRAAEGHLTEVDEEQEEDEEEEDESSKKQLSPVSVLEQRLFEHSPPPHAQSKPACPILSIPFSSPAIAGPVESSEPHQSLTRH